MVHLFITMDETLFHVTLNLNLPSSSNTSSEYNKEFAQVMVSIFLPTAVLVHI